MTEGRFQVQVSNKGKDMPSFIGSEACWVQYQINRAMQVQMKTADLSSKKKYKVTYWTAKEESQYIQYLKQNMPMVASPEFRKNARIFKKISTILGSRTPIQVKTHHQKMVAKYHTISALISSFQSKKREQGESKETSRGEQPQPTIVDGFDLDFNFLESNPCSWNRLIIREAHQGTDGWSEFDELLHFQDF